MSIVAEKLINYILQTRDFDFALQNGLETKQFIGKDAEFEYIKRFVDEFGIVPSIKVFQEQFKDWKFEQVDDAPEHILKDFREAYLFNRLRPILVKADALAVNDATEAAAYLCSVLESLPIQSMRVGEDITKTMAERLSKAMESGGISSFIPTGFVPLDREFVGWRKGEELVVVVARTGVGKSWFLLKSATTAWESGANVGFISPEMTAYKVGLRVDTLLTGTSNRRLLRGDLKTQEINELRIKAREIQEHSNGYYVATPKDFGGTVTTNKVRMFIKSRHLDAVFIDGFTYLSSERSYKGNNKTVCMTETAEDLMSISIETGVPIVCAIQANREGTDGAPRLEHVRDSDGVAHNASKVISLFQDGKAMILKVIKHRDGINNQEFRMAWDADTGVFNEISAEGEGMTENDFETV